MHQRDRPGRPADRSTGVRPADVAEHVAERHDARRRTVHASCRRGRVRLPPGGRCRTGRRWPYPGHDRRAHRRADPGIEIVDHRFESWAVGALRIAADNAIHGWWLRGEPVTDWRGHDLATSAVSVSRDGELVTTGSGAAVLGHPFNVMAWLADELPRFGLRLRRGDLVTTGVATDVFEAGAGESCVADFGPFGTVTVGFDDEGRRPRRHSRRCIGTIRPRRRAWLRRIPVMTEGAGCRRLGPPHRGALLGRGPLAVAEGGLMPRSLVSHGRVMKPERLDGQPTRLQRHVPGLVTVSTYQAGWLRSDLVAGVVPGGHPGTPGHGLRRAGGLPARERPLHHRCLPGGLRPDGSVEDPRAGPRLVARPPDLRRHHPPRGGGDDRRPPSPWPGCWRSSWA